MKKLLWRGGLVVAGLYLLATLLLVADGLHERPGKADVGLVLGSKVELDGRPSARLQARIDRAAELYKAGSFAWVIASGGVGKEGFDEAVVMRDALVAKGVPADHILLDSHGDTTGASARNTAVIAKAHGFHSVLAVSQYFHLPRCRLALERSGLGPVYSGSAHYFEWRDVYSALRETAGWVKYAVGGG